MQQYLSVYENRILAFVDILGFKNMVQISASNFQEQIRLMKAMEIIHSYRTLNDEGLDGGLFHVLLDLACLGIFIRGGVSIGLAHHDEFNAFGPAMVDAYELESKMAKYPRIILTGQTLSAGIAASKSHQIFFDISLLNSLIKQDTDGFYFLGYLSQYQELNFSEYDYYDWLLKIRKNLVYNLNVYYSDTEIHSKYLWMLNYWNNMLDPQTLSISLEQGTTKERGMQIFENYVKLKIKPLYPYN